MEPQGMNIEDFAEELHNTPAPSTCEKLRKGRMSRFLEAALDAVEKMSKETVH